MHCESPLRYPGGKAKLSEFLQRTISLNNLNGCSYYEPFAGGAGAAIRLLSDKHVSHLYLNDADRRIYALWTAILKDTKQFADRILSIPLTIDEWNKQHDICAHDRGVKLFDLGFAAFYMNRCNRSGILSGAGPIGGYKQLGEWGIDARFSRENLATRVLALGKLRDHITLANLDAMKFLNKHLPNGQARSKVFVYLDPPYVAEGKRLYLNHYNAGDHRALATYILRQKVLPWVMSYDDNPLIRELYSTGAQRYLFSLRYSLQKRTLGSELLIVPPKIKLPRSEICGIGSGYLVEVAA